MELHIDVKGQLLFCKAKGGEKVFVISSGKAGVGYEAGSGKTPLGRFRIAQKIGAGCSPNAIFKSRVVVGEWGGEDTDEDMILGRILWLEGMDKENANTKERYIYIHGTNVEASLGRACSHGCIRMSRADVCELFELICEGAAVMIEEGI